MPRQSKEARDDLETIRQLTELVTKQSQQLEILLNLNGQGNSGASSSNDNGGERFWRLRPPTFEGQSSDPTVAEEWIRTIERMFKYAKVEETDKVFLATFHLAKDARFWWETIETTTAVQDMTWEKFNEAFYDRYFNSTVQATKRMEFLQLKQTGSVSEYNQQFESLSRFVSHWISKNEDKVFHFVQGLKPEIYKGVKIAGTRGVSYSEVVAKALEVEEVDLKCVKQHETSRRFFRGDPQQQQRGTKRPIEGQTSQGGGKRPQGFVQYPQCPKCSKYHSGECKLKSGKCYNCNEAGHISRDCPKSKVNRCFNCNEPAHVANDCPTPKKGPARVMPRIFAMIESGDDD